MAKKPKKLIISDAHKIIYITVGVAAFLVGLGIVAIVRFNRLIAFNARVIGEKQTVSRELKSSITNLNTLSRNITDLNENENLASVEQDPANCDVVCVPIRVVPDSLPSFDNTEAMLASLNKIFIVSGTSPDSLSPSDDNIAAGSLPVQGVFALGANFSYTGTSGSVFSFLTTLERSIRAYDFTRATIEWSGDGRIAIRGTLNAYYAPEVRATLQNRTVQLEGSNR